MWDKMNGSMATSSSLRKAITRPKYALIIFFFYSTIGYMLVQIIKKEGYMFNLIYLILFISYILRKVINLATLGRIKLKLEVSTS